MTFKPLVPPPPPPYSHGKHVVMRGAAPLNLCYALLNSAPY